MAITKDEVVEYLKGMTLLEASELVKELEEVFGVSAAAAAAPMMMAAPGGGDAAPAAEEKDSFDVILSPAAAPSMRKPLAPSSVERSSASCTDTSFSTSRVAAPLV